MSAVTYSQSIQVHFDIVVVVGSVAAQLANCVSQVNALAVPLSFTLINNNCQFVGLHAGFWNCKAIHSDVISWVSVVLTSIWYGLDTGEALWTRFVIRLFVRVSVLLIVGTFTPSTAILPADTRDIVVSVVCQSSTEPTVIAFVVQYNAFIREVVSSPVFVPLTDVVPVTARDGVDEPVIVTVLYLPAVISPVVSAIVAALFCMSFHVVVSKRAIALSVALAGHTTSQLPPPLVIVTVTSFHTFVAVTQVPTKLKEETALVIVVPSSFTGIFALADMVTSPLPRSELPFTVLMFVQDTRFSCLSAFKLEKFVSITDFDAFIAFGSVVIVDIMFSYLGEIHVVQDDIVPYVSQVSDTALHISGALAHVYDWNPEILGRPDHDVAVGRDGDVHVVIDLLYEN